MCHKIKEIDSGSDSFFEEEKSDPEYFIQEFADHCPKHPWNDSNGCTACEYMASERCPKHPYSSKDNCAACDIEVRNNAYDLEGFWDYPIKCKKHPSYNEDICPYCEVKMCEKHPNFEEDNCWICSHRCSKHQFYSKKNCPICKPKCDIHIYVDKDKCEICNIKKCVHGHEISDIIDCECAYCYMIKYKNHRGKMLDWMYCPKHKGFSSKDRECPWCFLIRQEKCPKHPLIIKGHCDVCDYPKGFRKLYSKWDICPKDKGRLRMNCNACSKGLTHCPEHSDKVKNACEICYFRKCEKHPDHKKDGCVFCKLEKKINGFVNKGGNWKF